MAKLSDVNLSMQGEEKTTIKDHSLDYNTAAINTQTDFKIFKLYKKNGNGKVHIDGIDDVINPKTGKTERIYLLNGVHSIWATELVEQLKDKDFYRQNRRSLTFVKGICRIPKWDTNAIEFAENCRHNIGNKKRRTGSAFEFYEYNPAREAEERLAKEMLEIEMAIKVKEMNEEDVRKYASYFNVSFVDSLGLPKTIDGIRSELMITAKRNPSKFKEMIDNAKEVNISYLIKKALVAGKIELNRTPGTAYWSNGGRMITKIPGSVHPARHLTDLALSNTQEGIEFLNQLEATVM